VAWRKTAAYPAAAELAELEGYAAGYERAGDTERLAAVRSWIGMLHGAGGDPDLAELLLLFAREDRARGVA
jgi:hypothetical protein